MIEDFVAKAKPFFGKMNNGQGDIYSLSVDIDGHLLSVDIEDRRPLPAMQELVRQLKDLLNAEDANAVSGLQAIFHYTRSTKKGNEMVESAPAMSVSDLIDFLIKFTKEVLSS